MSAAHPQRRSALYQRLLPLPPVPDGHSAPTHDAAAARARLAGLLVGEDGANPAARSQLYEPDSSPPATLVIWHGFTNAPPQFAPAAAVLAKAGWRVLLPRMPRHGLTDVLTRELAELKVDELTTHADAWVDIAVGFGHPVWVLGLSAGATLAAWASATRPEVSRLVLAAPLVAPKGLPLPVVRMLVRFPRIVPNIFFWWDPRVKASLGHGPYVYPGFPMPGILPFLHLSEAMFDQAVVAGHRLERVVVTDNAGDRAIRRDAAKAFASHVFGANAQVQGVAQLDPSLGWGHDFVDPYSPHTGTPEQVAALILAAFGVGEPTGAGTLVPPLLPAQR